MQCQKQPARLFNHQIMNKFGRKRIQSPRALWRLRAYLKRGGIIAYPTESCYGLGGLPTHAGAIRRIIRLKKRPQNKGLIVIGNELQQLQPLLCRLPDDTQQQLQNIWPAPKTFVLSCRTKVHPMLRGARRRQLATRVPDHLLARQICREAKSALISTSCNRAKQKPCRNSKEARKRFGRQVWILGGQVGKRKNPSKIIDWSTKTQLR
ncbi:putative Sua5/YciO/YrdC/YwlC family protein [Kingella denitrificans ATCC 33394]|uniref:L-threonylcarbamoyladenylate synthase n=2 Tax=Kingella denitrificans TaxID=502 RepID=F0F0G7_9NEIS|nr:putative Sua5/YciO/YrdC/YwlC family protein [Kingella denitrificans ATCC 33394]